MLINEVSRLTGLTKKAIEYYTLQGLVFPAAAENGYRQYSKEDAAVLNKVGILRKLDVGIEDIKAILKDKTGSALQNVLVRKELDLQYSAMKKAALEQLGTGKAYSEIGAVLQAVEKSKTITEKLLDAFPGYYGRFICMHFARFLDEPIQTEEQQLAYETVLSFLDGVPPLGLPKDLEDYLTEGTEHIDTKEMKKMLENTKKSIENPEKFLSDNREMLKQYITYKQSDEYKSSPAGRLMEFMKRFNSTNGYYDRFLPAMKRLSASYAAYHRQLEAANEKLLEQFPEAGKA